GNPSWMSAPRLGQTTDGSVAFRRPVASTEPTRGAAVHKPMSSIPSGADDDANRRTFGMLSTCPPTACGIATFAAALSAALVARGAAVDVVRCGPDQALEDPLVVASLGDGSAARWTACVSALNATDVVIVQHEYG